MSHITAIVTCMGRLAHLQQTLPILLQGHTDVCVVDYSCPDGCGDWVDANYGDEGVYVERLQGRELFNKPEAQNAGAARAIERNPDTFLLFVDSDTIATPMLWAWLRAAVSSTEAVKHFYYIAASEAGRDSTGVLFVHGQAFARSGGYDERHQGWGAEDLDMRMRLFFKEQLGCAEIPAEAVSAIGHDDPTRVAHYEEKDKLASNGRNMQLLSDNVKAWSGISLHDAVMAVRLLGVRMVWPGEPV
jgi:hypothetical protein